MLDSSLKFLYSLLDARAPSGFESRAQKVWLDYVRSFAAGVEVDAYGNAVAWAGPKDAPVVMVTGHGDEIGLLVNHIGEKGLISFASIGGYDPMILVGRRVLLLTVERDVPGVIGAVPVHLQDKTGDRTVPKVHDLFIDVGVKNSEEVGKLGIEVGTPVVLAESHLHLSDNVLVSRALDNRIGVFCAAETLRLLSEKAPQGVRIAAVSTVQEEIGGAGAEMITHKLSPTAAFVVDVTHATDVPGIDERKHGAVKLGGGPTITHGSANHPALVRLLREAAKADSIAVQIEASSRYTGTDTDNIYKSLGGVPSALISLPNRYMHTPAEMIHLTDLEAIPRLIAGAVRKLQLPIKAFGA